MFIDKSYIPGPTPFEGAENDDLQAYRVQPLGCACANTQAKACTLYTCSLLERTTLK